MAFEYLRGFVKRLAKAAHKVGRKVARPVRNRRTPIGFRIQASCRKTRRRGRATGKSTGRCASHRDRRCELRIIARHMELQTSREPNDSALSRTNVRSQRVSLSRGLHTRRVDENLHVCETQSLKNCIEFGRS